MHEDAGHFAAKHPKGTKLNPQIARAVKEKISDGWITCAASHKIARDLKVTPAEVGVTVDLLEGRLSECQMGLFGYRPQKRIVNPAKTVSPEMEEAIKNALVDGRISCASCWKISEKLGVPKMKVSETCEKLEIKISQCQLGAFGKPVKV